MYCPREVCCQRPVAVSLSEALDTNTTSSTSTYYNNNKGCNIIMDQFGNCPRSPVCRRVQPFWMAKMESTDDLGPRKNLLENYKKFPDPCWAPPAAMVLLYMYQKDLDHVCEVATTGCVFST